MSESLPSYVPSGALGKITIGFLLFVTLLEGGSAAFVSGFSGIEAAQLSFPSTVYVLLSLVLIPALLATCFVFCLWWYRMVANLPALGAYDPECTPGMAVGSFFIPFVNLVRPHYVGQEIWKASDPGLVDNTPLSRKDRESSNLIGTWWMLFVVGRGIDGASVKIDDPTGATITALIGHLLTVAAGICAILVVKRIADRQEARFRVLAGADPIIPPQMETAGYAPAAPFVRLK